MANVGSGTDDFYQFPSVFQCIEMLKAELALAIEAMFSWYRDHGGGGCDDDVLTLRGLSCGTDQIPIPP